MKIRAAVVSTAFILAVLPAAAQQIALAPGNSDCGDEEPDTIQVSWTTPCEEWNWLLEPGVGCRMWDWHPDDTDRARWTGSCRASLKEGHGVTQWTEHGQSIDRFEGTYRLGRREGAGRYIWNEHDRFDGDYAQGLPNGYGTVTVNGKTLSGEWRNGCLKVGDNAVAIGVSLESCTLEPDYATQTAELPD